MQEMEEKRQLYGHGTKLDVLAQLDVTKMGDKELAVLGEKPPPLKTPDYHTTHSLGY